MSECKVCKEKFHYCSNCSLHPNEPKTLGFCSWDCIMEDKDSTIAALQNKIEDLLGFREEYRHHVSSLTKERDELKSRLKGKE